MINPDKIALYILEFVMIFLIALPVLISRYLIFPIGMIIFLYFMIIQSIKKGEETLIYKWVKGEKYEK